MYELNLIECGPDSGHIYCRLNSKNVAFRVRQNDYFLSKKAHNILLQNCVFILYM
jgi:hypothetical protein